MKALKMLAGSALAVALLGIAPVNAAPAGAAAIGIERSEVAPAAEAVHYRKYQHNHYRGHNAYRGDWDRDRRGYRSGYNSRPGIYLNLGGDRRGHRDGYRRNW